MFYSAKNFNFIFIILFLIVFIDTGKGQEALKPRSALSAGGSSGIITVNGRQYYLQQTTGQQSVTGISMNLHYMLRQGFIQPIQEEHKKLIKETLPVVIYPNPFSSHMNLSFTEETAGPLYVTIYSPDGKIAFLKKYETGRNIDLDLSSLPPSVYILRLTTSKKSLYSRIIKL
jgi:hypothetical protein